MKAGQRNPSSDGAAQGTWQIEEYSDKDYYSFARKVRTPKAKPNLGKMLFFVGPGRPGAPKSLFFVGPWAPGAAQGPGPRGQGGPRAQRASRAQGGLVEIQKSSGFVMKNKELATRNIIFVSIYNIFILAFLYDFI